MFDDLRRFVATMAAVLAASGCGGGGDAEQEPTPTPGNPSTVTPSTGSPSTPTPAASSPSSPSAATPLELDIQLEGAAERLTAEVTGNTTAHAYVTRYPTAFQLPVRQMTMSLGVPDEGPTRSFCDDQRAIAQLVAGGGAMAPQALSMLRRNIDVVLGMDAVPLLRQSVQQSLFQAASAAGSQAGILVVDNAFEFTDMTVRVEFDTQSIARLAGGVDDLAASIEQTMGAAPLTFGNLRIRTAGKDFLCDLWDGHARVIVTWNGTAGNATHSGTTTLSGLVQP